MRLVALVPVLVVLVMVLLLRWRRRRGRRSLCSLRRRTLRRWWVRLVTRRPEAAVAPPELAARGPTREANTHACAHAASCTHAHTLQAAHTHTRTHAHTHTRTHAHTHTRTHTHADAVPCVRPSTQAAAAQSGPREKHRYLPGHAGGDGDIDAAYPTSVAPAEALKRQQAALGRARAKFGTGAELRYPFAERWRRLQVLLPLPLPLPSGARLCASLMVRIPSPPCCRLLPQLEMGVSLFSLAGGVPASLRLPEHLEPLPPMLSVAFPPDALLATGTDLDDRREARRCRAAPPLPNLPRSSGWYPPHTHDPLTVRSQTLLTLPPSSSPLAANKARAARLLRALVAHEFALDRELASLAPPQQAAPHWARPPPWLAPPRGGEWAARAISERELPRGVVERAAPPPPSALFPGGRGELPGGLRTEERVPGSAFVVAPVQLAAGAGPATRAANSDLAPAAPLGGVPPPSKPSAPHGAPPPPLGRPARGSARLSDAPLRRRRRAAADGGARLLLGVRPLRRQAERAAQAQEEGRRGATARGATHALARPPDAAPLGRLDTWFRTVARPILLATRP